ncbi:CBS domain-containing protein [Kitasatospora sp. NBC_00315]|uniref:CBS domain-containing protein n=1 Tax=Kitasatospora sp. NBC_00315 TaxID=2975963 RepID=UPI0032516F0D
MTNRPTPEELQSLKGRQVTPAEILALFGLRVRDRSSVHTISQALSDAGLATLPDFAVCRSGDLLEVVAIDGALMAGPVPEDEEAQEQDALPSYALPQQLQIGDLVPSGCDLVHVGPGDQLTKATYLMRTKTLEQIPVITGGTLHGVVSWRSVAKAYENGLAPTLENAMQKGSLPVADARQEFFSCLTLLREHGYLVVRGEDGSFPGIVTTTAVTDRFEGAARPFFQLGEIESLLRRVLGTRLSQDAIRAVQTNRKPDQRSGLVTDLMFGDYVRLLDGTQNKQALATQADVNWATLGWTAMDRAQFVEHLERVKDIRNRIAHFDADPLPDALLGELATFIKLLRDFVA